MTDSLRPDATVENTDWLRSQRWDLPTDPALFRILIAREDMTDEQGLAAFMALPAALVMPAQLRADLGEPFLEEAMAELLLERHYGPGKHPDGSDQKVHAGPTKGSKDLVPDEVTEEDRKRLDEASATILGHEAEFFAAGGTIDFGLHTPAQRDGWLADAHRLATGLGYPQNGDERLSIAVNMVDKALWRNHAQTVALTAEGHVAGVYGFYEGDTLPGYEGKGFVGSGTMGSFNILPGTGSALFASVVRYVASKGYFIGIDAIHEAAPFWRKMGFIVDEEHRPESRPRDTPAEMPEAHVQYLAGLLGDQP